MKRVMLWVLIIFISTVAPMQAESRYRFTYTLSGSAEGKILLFFSFRVFYEASAGVDLMATPQPDGRLNFRLEKLSQPGFLMRTLGLTGKSLALVSADKDFESGLSFANHRLQQWQGEAQNFSSHINTIKTLPFVTENISPEAFSFNRRADGGIESIKNLLSTRYKYHPASIGMYFKIFPMISVMLDFYNYSYIPNGGLEITNWPLEWLSKEIDISNDMNRVGALTEKIVADNVEFKQTSKFQLKFRRVLTADGIMEIIGENHEAISIWKGYKIRDVVRKIHYRVNDMMLLRDEWYVNIRNKKNQGGFARLCLCQLD